MIKLEIMITKFFEQLELSLNTIPAMITITAKIAERVFMFADLRFSFNDIPITVPSVRNDEAPLIMDINIERSELSHQTNMP